MKVAVFLTRGQSIDSWDKAGLLKREIKIYQKLAFEQQVCYEFYTYDKATYDGGDAHEYGRKGKWYEAKNNFLYGLQLPFIYYSKLKRCDVIKTNQMDGALPAVLAKLILRKKLYLRTGYSLYRFHCKRKLTLIQKFKNSLIKLYEKLCINFSDVFSVSSEHDKEFYIREFNVPEKKIEVIKNYVELPTHNVSLTNRLDEFLFVGRLSEQKNLENIISAFNQLDLKLNIVGDGELAEKLKSIANDNVKFLGRMPHEDILELYSRYKYYILASRYEGMPKTLIEAMSRSSVCFGTDVEGINELIDNTCGYKIENTSVESIVAAIGKLGKGCDEKKSKEARNKINQQHSLESISKKEYQVYIARLV